MDYVTLGECSWGGLGEGEEGALEGEERGMIALLCGSVCSILASLHYFGKISFLFLLLFLPTFSTSMIKVGTFFPSPCTCPAVVEPLAPLVVGAV